MKKILQVMGAALLVLLISACAEGQDSPIANDSTAPKEQKTTDEEVYHLPVLEGWTETAFEKKKIGNGMIDLWTTEFSFEGELEAQFEQYVAALEDWAFEVEIELDEEFMKEVKFTKDVKGEVHDGVSTFHNNVVQSMSQFQSLP